MHREGAELAFTFQNDEHRDRVIKMAAERDADRMLPCDVSSDEHVDAVFSGLGQHWDGLDRIVHSVAFAPRRNWKAIIPLA